MENQRRIALLIDGDNAQASLLGQMLAEVSKYGVITIRRVYGDWTENGMKSWKTVLHSFALQPFQQFSYTSGKNSTDSALIIDAMDILYTAGVDGFCIASSDSDFTRLATRIREKNLFVMGIGRRITPRAFVSACDVFVYTENLKTEEETLGEIPIDASSVTPINMQLETTKQQEHTLLTENLTPQLDVSFQEISTGEEHDITTFTVEPNLGALLQTAFELAEQEDGWAHLGTVGHFLRQNDPGFDPRTYGSKLLSQLIIRLAEEHPEFIELDKRRNKSGNADYYIRVK